MNDKEYNAQLKRVHALLKKWAPLLLPGWEATYQFFRGPFAEPVADGRTPLADMRATWQYMDFRMRWDLEQAAAQGDTELEKYVIHEFCHGLLNEMRDYDTDNNHEERVATTVQIALSAMYEAGYLLGQKAAKVKA